MDGQAPASEQVTEFRDRFTAPAVEFYDPFDRMFRPSTARNEFLQALESVSSEAGAASVSLAP
jgi:hypothetical protein